MNNNSMRIHHFILSLLVFVAAPSSFAADEQESEKWQ